MKCYLAIVVLFLFGSAAHADLCGKYLPCGSFRGEMTPGEVDQGQVLAIETAEIAAGSEADSLVVNGTLSRTTGEQIWKYTLVLKFAADGSFQMLMGEEKIQVGSGYCEGNLCAYAFRPAGNLSTTGNLFWKDGVLYRSHANKETNDEFTLLVSKMKQQ